MEALDIEMFKPFDNLPDDLLTEIFLRCLPTCHNPTFSVKRAPSILLLVCRRWQQVALRSPELWSSLHIHWKPPVKNTVLNMIRWLMKSGQLPLSISIAADTRTSIITRLRPCLKTLEPFFPRIDSFSIDLRGPWKSLTLTKQLELDSASHPFRHIQRLDLSIEYLDNTQPDDPNPGAIFQKLGSVVKRNKNLREVRIVCPAATVHLSGAFVGSLHWATLEMLDLGVSCGDDCHSLLKLLECASCLSYLRLAVSFRDETTTSSHKDHPDVTLPSLKFLQLSTIPFGPEGPARLLSKCRFPSLTCFFLWAGAHFKHYRSFREAIEWSGPTLTILNLAYREVPAEEMVTLLESLKNLVHLEIEIVEDPQNPGERGIGALGSERGRIWNHIDGRGSGDAIVEVLTPGRNGAIPLCPKLQYLRWLGHAPFSDQAVADLLLQRGSSLQTQDAPMKCVQMEFDRAMELDIKRECAKLISTGLDLRLQYKR